MISGKVQRLGEGENTGKPRVPLTVANVMDPDRTLTIDVIVDTGFTGFLTLRPEHIQQLDLLLRDEQWMTLADGSIRRSPTYVGLVSWDVQYHIIPILESPSEPLLGMALMWGSRLTIDVRQDGAVAIEAAQPP